MSNVFVAAAITLDGFMAGPNNSPANPMGDNASKISSWLFKQRSFRQHLGIDDGGDTGKNNQITEETFNRIGANIMGNKMFKEGEAAWPEKAPFGCPVFVLTHEKREPWVRPGGTTFYFTNESLEAVLEKAKAVAGNKDVRISGGGSVIQQYINAGLVDELLVHISPVFLGGGTRLLNGLDGSKNTLELIEAIGTPEVTHLRYAIKRS